MSFPDEISNVYYINLDRRQDRRQQMESEFKRVEIPIDKIERFEAIDGNLLDKYNISQKEEAYFNKSDFNHRANKPYLMGNQLSHCRILEDIIKNKYPLSLIFQDDLVFHDTFNQELQNIVNHIPNDTEIIWIGFHKFASGKKIVSWDLTNQTIETNPHYRPNSIDNPYIGSCKSVTNPCSTAYLVTYQGAVNFMDHVYNIGCPRATDGNFNDYLRAKNIDYCSKIVLCTGLQKFGSDIF